MLKERARIVAVDNDAVWVETIQLSTCGSCVAKKGCGQSLLASLGAKPNYLRVLLPEGRLNGYQLDQSVTIGLPENIVVNTSLLLYLLPLGLMLFFSALAHHYYANELLTIVMASVGLCFGGIVIRFYSYKYKYDQRFQPTIVEVVKVEEQIITFNESALQL
jgi:sigma-E factor negative regulatory protein RseC